MVLSLSPASTSSLVSSISDLADRVDRLLSQPTAKLALTAAAASAVTLASVLGTQAFQRRRRARRLKRDVLSSAFINPSASDLKNLIPTATTAASANGGPASTASPIELSPEEESLVQEQLSRNISFLGQPGARKVRNSFVIVVGCGGVGSWAALMLLRSGVERIRVIDFDQVTLSSLNRHAVATRADVGVPKVNALKRHAREIVPHAVVDARVELFDIEAAERLLDGNPDYVLDCIDNMKTKLDLLKFCHDKKLPVISSMGAGAKADPSRVQIADISETFEDPLARATRRSLRKMGVESGIDVVYSTEKPGAVKLMPLDESQKENAEDFAALPTFRVRILPVLGTLPAIFGMSMASYVVLKLANFPVEPLAVKLREGLYTRLFRDLRHREANVYKATEMRVDVRDVGYVYEEIFRGRSAVSGITEKLALTRWDSRKPFTLQNCVVLTKNEADFHDKLETSPEEHYSASIVEYVRSRFREEAAISKIRD